MRQRFRAGRLALGVSVSRGGGGFSLVELLIGMTILAVGLLGIATMFSTGYTDIAAGGKTTAAIEAARQIMEDIRLIPTQAQFANVYNLNQNGVFDTTLLVTLPMIFETTTVYTPAELEVATSVNTLLVAPLIAVPLKYHW